MKVLTVKDLRDILNIIEDDSMPVRVFVADYDLDIERWKISQSDDNKIALILDVGYYN